MVNINSENITEFINFSDIEKAKESWNTAVPFSHCVIDNFLSKELALDLEKEFPSFDSDVWHSYKNAIEDKKVSNNWNYFPENTYSVVSALNSEYFTNFLSVNLLNGVQLFSDGGLNGGGWHIHSKGGKLNQHLDYSLHPKLHKQRKLNIIIYLNSSWQDDWGGTLGFWSNESPEKPGKLIKEVVPT